MQQEEKRFTAHQVDEQFEQFAQTTPSPSDTPNSRVVHGLQTVYGQYYRQEQQSLERMHQRLSLSVAAKQEEQREIKGEHMVAAYEVANVPGKSLPIALARPLRPWLRNLEQGVAVLLVLVIIAGWFALSHLPHSSSGSSAVFNDASAQPLGAPISTIKGNFSSVEEWSPDNHTLVLLQVDKQKHTLNVQMVDVASKHSTSYPVLDSSWISALDLYDPFEILMGRYLLAARAEGKNQATLEIWDIPGRRAVSIQTIPALLAPNGQVSLPWIVSSKSEQKVALLSPDGTIAIWDVASGRKLLTCEGKVSSRDHFLPSDIRWYNNDQSLLLFSNDSNLMKAWNTATGMSLFNLSYADKTFSTPLVSPNSKYLFLTVGHRPPTGTSFHANTLEILDAHSGQVLHSFHQNIASNTEIVSAWLADSQHMLLMYMHTDNFGTSPSLQAQAYVWNAFTDQKMFMTAFLQSDYTITPDGEYLILGNNQRRSIDIWQTNSGHKVATLTTPGVYAREDSFFYTNNQQIVIGQKGDFDIWDIASGKLLYSYHGFTPFSIDGVSGSIVFWSPDGKYLTLMAGTSTSIGDGMASTWRLP